MGRIVSARRGRLLLASGLALASLAWGCDRPPDYGLPPVAREVLLREANEHYETQALRLGAYDDVPELGIHRVWRGKVDAFPAGAKHPPEVWCAELAIKARRGGQPLRERAVWIVVHNVGMDEWGASLLMAMSSIWPYEACGVMPGTTPAGER